jgi:hypothetical protein
MSDMAGKAAQVAFQALWEQPRYNPPFELKLARVPTRSLLPSQLYLDHSHCHVLAPATLAALPSTRAIETRLLPSSLAATHRGFAFYVAFPKRSIPSLATCSMSLIRQLHSYF